MKKRFLSVGLLLLGAMTAAAQVSLVNPIPQKVTTTAKANGLNPRLYVEWLLTEMPNTGELTDEVVDSFLPWSDRVPES